MAQLVKNPSAMQETWVRFLDSEDSPRGGHSNSLQYACLENSHGQRSLAGYSPWDCQESDTTERLSLTHTHTHTQVMVMILVTGDDDSFTERAYTAGGTRVRLGMGTGGRGAGTPCAAGPPEAPAVAASGMGICNSLALIFKLLEFCSSAPPNLGEVRHMESREQC